MIPFFLLLPPGPAREKGTLEKQKCLAVLHKGHFTAQCVRESPMGVTTGHCPPCPTHPSNSKKRWAYASTGNWAPFESRGLGKVRSEPSYLNPALLWVPGQTHTQKGPCFLVPVWMQWKAHEQLLLPGFCQLGSQWHENSS